MSALCGCAAGHESWCSLGRPTLDVAWADTRAVLGPSQRLVLFSDATGVSYIQVLEPIADDEDMRPVVTVMAYPEKPELRDSSWPDALRVVREHLADRQSAATTAHVASLAVPIAKEGVLYDVAEGERPDHALCLEVAFEGQRAADLHGEPADRPGRDWLAILAEEFGEVAMEVTRGEVPPVNRDRAEYLTNLRGELVQVASVAMRWLAAVDREIGGPA